MIFQVKKETSCNSKELISIVLETLISRKNFFEAQIIEQQMKLQNLQGLITEITEYKKE